MKEIKHKNPPSEQKKPIGTHFILDFWGARNLENAETLEQSLRQAAEVAGATCLQVNLHHFGEGQGVTGVALLAESHISVHTWPELNYAAFDIFMCGACQAELSVALLKEVFAPERCEIKKILRGES